MPPPQPVVDLTDPMYPPATISHVKRCRRTDDAATDGDSSGRSTAELLSSARVKAALGRPMALGR